MIGVLRTLPARLGNRTLMSLAAPVRTTEVPAATTTTCRPSTVTRTPSKCARLSFSSGAGGGEDHHGGEDDVEGEFIGLDYTDERMDMETYQASILEVSGGTV